MAYAYITVGRQPNYKGSAFTMGLLLLYGLGKSLRPLSSLFRSRVGFKLWPAHRRACTSNQ